MSTSVYTFDALKDALKDIESSYTAPQSPPLGQQKRKIHQTVEITTLHNRAKFVREE